MGGVLYSAHGAISRGCVVDSLHVVVSLPGFNWSSHDALCEAVAIAMGEIAIWEWSMVREWSWSVSCARWFVRSSLVLDVPAYDIGGVLSEVFKVCNEVCGVGVVVQFAIGTGV